MREEGKSVIFKGIEMGSTAFERESFVPVCTSEPFEVQTKVGEVQMGTNDSFSNGINEIKKS